MSDAVPPVERPIDPRAAVDERLRSWFQQEVRVAERELAGVDLARPAFRLPPRSAPRVHLQAAAAALLVFAIGSATLAGSLGREHAPTATDAAPVVSTPVPEPPPQQAIAAPPAAAVAGCLFLRPC